MTRTVTDAAILLNVLTGKDEADFAMKSLPENQFNQDYTQFLDKNALAGARIGIARSFFNFHEKVDKVIEDAIGSMKENGAIFVDLADYKIPDEANKAQWLVLLYEFKAGVNNYLSTLPADYPIKSSDLLT
jgi:amidase